MGGVIVRLYTEPHTNYSPEQYAWCRKEIERIKDMLKSRNLPLYQESDPPLEIPSHIEFSVELSRSATSRFRFLAAKIVSNPDWILPEDLKDYHPVSDIEYQQICRDNISHIPGMPDVHGYYIPVLFQSLSRSLSPKLGSSITFQSELREMALKLNISHLELDSYHSNLRMPNDVRIHELKQEVFGEEKGYLLSLYAIAIASIYYNRIIYFTE